MAVLELLIVLLLILINGVLAMSELAVISARRSRLQGMIERRVRGARRALRLASDPGRFLSTVQIGITLVGILAGAFSGATLGSRLGDWLVSAGLSPGIAHPLGFGIVITFITYLSLVIGELVPKQLALRHAERIACFVAPAMVVLARIASPFVWILDRSGSLILLLLGRRQEGNREVTEDEIRVLVAEAESAGVIEPEEKRMITAVMRLGDRPVRSVMTPRTEVDMVDLSDTPAEIRRTIVESVHSRIPAYDGNADEIIGVIHAKDMLDAYLKRRKVDARQFVRTAPVIPDTLDALEVIEKLKNSGVHMGLVHDEYGHFEGVVTSADVLEAIAGAFRTAEGEPEPNAVQRDDGSWLLSGTMPVDELTDITAIELPQRRDFHTLAGFALEQLGHIPELGETFDSGDWRFEIVDLDGRRIDKILARRLPQRSKVLRSA
ncbi:MAG: hemolysin family protein [Hyphomicrobiales bacterium]